jgi:CheY-like chemotaxis protein
MPENKDLDPQVIKERIGKHLRTADEFARQQRYEEALLEIDQALEIDPKNQYARSFHERVKLMHKRSQPKESGQVEEGNSLEERMAAISRYLSTAEVYINKREFARALEEVAKVYKIDPKNYYAQTYSERIDILMHDKSIENDKPVASFIQPVVPDVQPEEIYQRGSTQMYYELLKEVWFDGKITEQESHEMSAFRELFGITDEEHVKFEREIKVQAYLEALRIAWRDHSLSGLEQNALQGMLEKYAISKEEQTEAESRYAEISKPALSRGVILVVDKDRQTLVSMSKGLQSNGITVLLAQRVEDALQILSTHTPAFIFSEIVFRKDEMDGIEFRKKIGEHEVLRSIPFIFISSLSDKKVIHACYRLGADNVLLKPIDIPLVMSIVEGKLPASAQGN